MLRRALLAVIALALVATAAGCGSKAGSGSNGLGDALQYVPKNAPVVVAVDTDPNGDQWQQVDELIGKFPFGGTAKQQFKASLNARSGVDWDKDVKPMLGDDFVLAVTAAPRPPLPTPYLIAWKVKDEGTARRLLEARAQKIGTVNGADEYQTKSGNFTALKDGVLLSARKQNDLNEAIDRAGRDHMSEQDFTGALGDLDKNALVRITGDFQQLLSDPSTAAARKVKWVAALRTFGATLSAESDGVKWAFDAKTEGGLSEGDLPLASGSAAAPVVRRAGEVGFGVRNPAQLYAFGKSVAQLTDPSGFAKFQGEKAKLGKDLGVDIDRDLIGQLTGNASVSVALTGGFAIKADLRDPAAATATLKRAVPRLKKAASKHGKAIRVVAPKNGKGFYAVDTPSGKKLAFGVVGKSFVLATDAARAAQFAGQSASTVPGTHGSLVTASDARALANEIAKQRGQGVAAEIITGSLGDLIGSVETETGGISGTLKLFIK